MKTPDEKSCKVLVVDDEENILIGFTKAFKDEFNIVTANSAEEALKYLEKDPAIGVVVSDQRMAGMNGVKLLSILKANYPDIVRILITGYSDIMVAIDAINKGDVFRYIHKPIEEKIVADALNEAVHKYSSDKEKRAHLEHTMHTIQKNTVCTLEGYTGWIAHHISNAMQAVTTYVDLSAPRFNKTEAEKDFAALTQSYARRVGDIIKTLYDIFSTSLKRFVKVPLSTLLEFENEEIKKAIEAKKIMVKKHASAPKLEIMVDPEAIRAVIRRLVQNSVEASPEGATVEVSAAPHQSDGHPAVMFEVKDRGCGIPAELKDKLFFPFLKTTDGENLRGLGLPYVQAVVARHGGDIHVDSSAGKGTVVSFSLPIIQDEKKETQTPVEAELDQRAREILKKKRG